MAHTVVEVEAAGGREEGRLHCIGSHPCHSHAEDRLAKRGEEGGRERASGGGGEGRRLHSPTQPAGHTQTHARGPTRCRQPILRSAYSTGTTINITNRDIQITLELTCKCHGCKFNSGCNFKILKTETETERLMCLRHCRNRASDWLAITCPYHQRLWYCGGSSPRPFGFSVSLVMGNAPIP